MIDAEKEYWELNNNEEANLQYAVDNGLAAAEDIAPPEKSEKAPAPKK